MIRSPASESLPPFPVDAPTREVMHGVESCPSEWSIPKSIKILAGVWLLLILTGSLLMARYSQTAGSSGAPPDRWPIASHLARDPDLSQLVLFLHPRCACSRATLGELELLMAHCQGLVAAQVLFVQPEGTTEDWVQTDLWRTASAIPGVRVGMDRAGSEARCFGSATSGQALLYDANGTLIFRGGITLARGHSGDNPGRSALESLLRHESISSASTPVFGCALSEKEARYE